MRITRKILTLLLTLTLCCSLSAPALAANWYDDAARWAQEQELIASVADMERPVTAGELSAMLAALTGSAKADGTDELTRMEAVTMLADALRPASSAADWQPFTDVTDDALAWAWLDGVVLGVGGGAFAPDAPCTRAQAVTMLYRWARSGTRTTRSRPSTRWSPRASDSPAWATPASWAVTSCRTAER